MVDETRGEGSADPNDRGVPVGSDPSAEGWIWTWDGETGAWERNEGEEIVRAIWDASSRRYVNISDQNNDAVADESVDGAQWAAGMWEWNSLEPAPDTRSPDPSSDEEPGDVVFRDSASVVRPALIAALIGWLLLGFVVVISAPDVACTAHRGDAFQDCVRGDDLVLLRTQAVVMGLALASFVPLVCGLNRKRLPHLSDRPTKIAVAVSGSLVALSIVRWITGSWVPDRPVGYEPVSFAEVSMTMLVGSIVGLVIGIAICATSSYPHETSPE